jgi:hypothetical protein
MSFDPIDGRMRAANPEPETQTQTQTFDGEGIDDEETTYLG